MGNSSNGLGKSGPEPVGGDQHASPGEPRKPLLETGNGDPYGRVKGVLRLGSGSYRRGMTDETIRPAEERDVPAVRAVTDAAYRPYVARIGVVPAPMTADHAADVAGGKVFVTGEPVTGLVVVEALPGRLFLESVAVHPDARGRGVGRRLLRFVDARARTLGLPEVRLYTNALMWENQELYPRYGYEVVERRVDGPYDRVHYRKRLGGGVS
jgi:ribosomal protein S18 acetylase RimI-like enzyme